MSEREKRGVFILVSVPVVAVACAGMICNGEWILAIATIFIEAMGIWLVFQKPGKPAAKKGCRVHRFSDFRKAA